MFVFNLMLMKTLGPSDFGLWSFLISWTGIFSIFVDFGFNPLIAREVAKQPNLGRTYLRHVWVTKGLLFAAGLLGILGISYYHPYAGKHLILVGLMYLYLAGQSFAEAAQVFMHAFEKFKQGFVLSAAYRLSLSATGIGLLLCGESLSVLLLGLAFIALVGVLGTYWRLDGWIVPPNKDEHPVSRRSIILLALPLFIQNVFIAIYFKIDTLLLTSFRGLEETGIYNVAYRFFELSNLIPTALLAASVASLSREITPTTRWRVIMKKVWWFFGAAWLGIAVLFGISLTISQGWLGPGYEQSPRILRILSAGLVFYYPNFLLLTVLLTQHKSTRMVLISAAAVLFNVVLNLYLIPTSGAAGAAWATISTEAFISILCIAAIIVPPISKTRFGGLST